MIKNQLLFHGKKTKK